ncbi:MAG: hypothetical protein HC822_23765, partial [Oscillochloris sp.]|nr:hypothetical protein [Oscillochloris sp.]
MRFETKAWFRFVRLLLTAILALFALGACATEQEAADPEAAVVVARRSSHEVDVATADATAAVDAARRR